jgi:hypothetical protein
MTTRTYEAVVNQALLMASPAQEVFNFLKNRAEKKEGIRFEKEADKELELNLLSRNDPLINLGLAKYGAYSETLQNLFRRPTHTEEGKALRYCLLSNKVEGGGLLDSLPSSLFETQDQQLEYFKNIRADEVYVLFQNPNISDSFLRDFYEKDGELFFNEAVRNEKLWKDKQSRDALRQVAWAVVNSDKHSDLTGANIYNHVAEEMAKKHPQWFVGDEDIPDIEEPEDTPATKGDLNQVAVSITQVTTNLVQETMQKMSKQVSWIWWFSLGALVATLLKH